MKSIGETLRLAREERNISVEQAVHETNISKNFIKALENENFNEFMAETYLIGFLRNYAEFLGLEVDKIVGQYRNYKMNEEPIPLDALVGLPKGAILRRIILWTLLSLGLISGGVLLVTNNIISFESFRKKKIVERVVPSPVKQIKPTIPFWEGEIHSGDTLLLEDSAGLNTILLSLKRNSLELDSGDFGQWRIARGEEVYIPGKTGQQEWRIHLKKMGLPNDGAILEIQKVETVSLDDEPIPEFVEIEPPSGDEERRRETKTILTAKTPGFFSLDLAFRGFNFFRYKIDNQNMVEGYYADDDNLHIEAEKTIIVWTSNAGTVYANVHNEEVPLGFQGKVSVGQIQWLQENDQYKLTLVPLY